MTAAHLPIQRPRQAKLLAIDRQGHFKHWPRSQLANLFRPGDLVIANDAATAPASLSGEHLKTGGAIEIRLAARRSLAADDICCFKAVVFGAGDFRMRTEDRPPPPDLKAGDRLRLGPLQATIHEVLGHRRLVRIIFDGSPNEIWEGIARHGRPIQYSHVRTPLELWDVWTPVAGLPVAFEPPSAGFALDWNTLASFQAGGIQFATITHAAGISSTGDAGLDALLPFDEPYFIPCSTASSIRDAQARNARIIAIGTTVVRALEDSAAHDGSVRAGAGLARLRTGRGSRLRVVHAILSGTHEPGTSHHELLRAFVDEETLCRMDRELNLRDYRTHEYGDSVFVEQATSRLRQAPDVSKNPPITRLQDGDRDKETIDATGTN